MPINRISTVILIDSLMDSAHFFLTKSALMEALGDHNVSDDREAAITAHFLSSRQ